MATLNYLFLMIVLKDVHQHHVITWGNSPPEGTHSVNYNSTVYRQCATRDSGILFHSSTSAFELVKAGYHQHAALSQI